jgi:hypothetical protein
MLVMHPGGLLKDANGLDGSTQPPEKSSTPDSIYSNSGMHKWQSQQTEKHAKSGADTHKHVLVGDLQIDSASAKPPVPSWAPSECIGQPATLDAGRDMESRALSMIGKRIDDGLGADGCMHSVSAHILNPHLRSIGESAPVFDSTAQFTAYAKHHPELFTISKIPQRALRSSDLQPGDIIIGNKSDGDHCMVATRLPAGWGGSEQAIAMLGNTGHPEWVPDGPNAPHFRVQEFIGTRSDENSFGTHHGGPESASASNPYNLPGATWTVIRLKK